MHKIQKRNVTIFHSDDGMLYRVKVGDQRMRTFRGESAWSDAQRYANDHLPWNERVFL